MSDVNKELNRSLYPKLLIRQRKTPKSLIIKNRQSIWDLLHLKKADY
jgi:hypothetical protein